MKDGSSPSVESRIHALLEVIAERQRLRQLLEAESSLSFVLSALGKIEGDLLEVASNVEQERERVALWMIVDRLRSLRSPHQDQEA
jgi:hypothetical protein